MPSWAFDQASSADRRAAMLSGHFLPSAYSPDSGRDEKFLQDRPVHPFMARSNMITNEQNRHVLPPVASFFQVADNHCVPRLPASFVETAEDVQSVAMISPPPTPGSPEDYCTIVRGVKRSSESPSVFPVSRSRKAKRQRLEEMTPPELKAHQELEARVGAFLDEKAKAAAEKASKLTMPPKKVVHRASDSKTNHNVSQTHLRGKKGSQRLTSQRMLCSDGLICGELQTKKNALSSGLICEEVSLQRNTNRYAMLGRTLLDIFCKDEHRADIVAMLPEFQPHEIRPEDGSEAAKFKVMLEADQPFRWQDMREEAEVRRVLGQLKSFSTATGRAGIDEFLNNMPRSQAARL